MGLSREVKGEGTIPRAWVIKKARVARGGEGIKVMINSRRPLSFENLSGLFLYIIRKGTKERVTGRDFPKIVNLRSQ